MSSSESLPSDVRARLTSQFAELRSAGFSGVVQVKHGGEVLFHAAAGRATAERDMAEGAVFDAASVSKTYTAMAILALVEAGQLSLDDRLGDLLANAPADKAAITVRQLLTHTAGIVDFFDGEGDYAPVGRDQAVANLLVSPLDFPPGAQHSYSNGGYNLLGAIVELRSGQSLDEYLRARIFARAGVDASLDYRRFPADRLASRPFPDGDWRSPVDVMPGGLQPLWRLWGAGGVFIDAAGMLAVSSAFAEGRIVSRALVEEALAVRVREGDDQSPSAATLVGVIYDTNRGDRLHYHNGGGLLSNADVRNYLDRNTIVSAMSNSRVPGATRVSREMSEIVFGPDLTVEIPPPPPGTPISERHAARTLFDAFIAAGVGSQDDRHRFIADHVTPGFVERRGGDEETVRFFFSLGRVLARPRLVAATDAGGGSFNFLVQALEREQPGYDLVTLRTQRAGERLLLDGLAARRVA